VTAPEGMHGDPELDALACREQQAAAKVALETARALRARGYDFVVVRVVKVVGRRGELAAPGASAIEASEIVLPALRLEAQSLRRMADDLDEAFRRAGVREAEEGYVEDAAHRFEEFSK